MVSRLFHIDLSSLPIYFFVMKIWLGHPLSRPGFRLPNAPIGIFALLTLEEDEVRFLLFAHGSFGFYAWEFPTLKCCFQNVAFAFQTEFTLALISCSNVFHQGDTVDDELLSLFSLKRFVQRSSSPHLSLSSFHRSSQINKSPSIRAFSSSRFFSLHSSSLSRSCFLFNLSTCCSNFVFSILVNSFCASFSFCFSIQLRSGSFAFHFYHHHVFINCPIPIPPSEDAHFHDFIYIDVFIMLFII